MADVSDTLLQLHPVTFRYRHELDEDGIPQFGLIAEDVEKVNPSLVLRDEVGNVSTVRYDAIIAMLLNEFLKARRQLDEETRRGCEQEASITELTSRRAKQELAGELQQKQIEVLTAGLEKLHQQVAPRRFDQPRRR